MLFKNSKGFSLVELLVVLALMGAIFAIGIPAIVSQMSHLRLTRSVREVSSELQAARLKAIARNTKYRVDFTQGSPDTYRLATWNTGTGAWENDATRTTMSLESGINISTPNANFMVVFYPNGISSSADNATAAASSMCIDNTAKANDKMTITIQGSTGMISVTTGC
ncbi:MAG: GspH/FimT family pseudopilin [Deltaproteobacteria bacterium]|nr:GspH/FimT family pseudopilin [Deltaproteobacteria bacterium]